MRNSCKVSEVFDPVLSLIAADWHMCNPLKNDGFLMPMGLFRLVKIGWLTLAQVGQHFSPIGFAMLKEYNDLPGKWRYPFVVPARERMPSACGCVGKLASPFIGTTIRTASFSL